MYINTAFVSPVKTTRSLNIHRFPQITLAALLAISTPSALVYAQQLSSDTIENPIYLADSAIANDSFIRLSQLIAQDNLDEAVRLVHQTISELGDRLIESPSSTISVPVRQRMHRFVLDQPKLMNAYRLTYSPSASLWLNDGDWQRVYQQAWLTESGFHASLHQAQTLIEAAHFHSGARVLAELETHPDAKSFASSAVKLAVLAASSTNDSSLWSLADHWTKLAGFNPVTRKQTSPPDHQQDRVHESLLWSDRHATSTKVSQPPLLDGIVPGALGKTDLSPASDLDLLDNEYETGISGANFVATPWVSPVAVGDKLYTNDGITISCFDRFTLRTIWRIQTAKEQDIENLPISPVARARTSRLIEDSTTITAIGSHLYVPAGLPRNGLRSNDNKLYKINAKTGNVEWSVLIQEIDPSLANTSIRGQVIVDQGVVIFGARTKNRQQRLTSLAVVGLDAATGNLLWIRQIASAGSLPFQQMGQLAHSPTLHDGVVYWTDNIGLGFAIESATGRVIWARSLPSPDIYQRFSQPSFSTNTPVITEQGLFTITADGTRILLLDLQTGETIATRNADPIGESLYLLRVGDLIACVSKYRISYYSIKQFEHAAVFRSSTLSDTDGIRGRVQSVSNQLIVPIASGIEVLYPKQPRLNQKIKLDSSGTVLALDGQILVVNESSVSSYLSWETASAILAQRISTDPSAAITLAQLAYRANRPQETLSTVKQAIHVINQLPQASRDELGAHSSLMSY